MLRRPRQELSPVQSRQRGLVVEDGREQPCRDYCNAGDVNIAARCRSYASVSRPCACIKSIFGPTGTTAVGLILS